MTDSRQLDILKKLTNQLQGIIPANGYDFDMSASVFRGRHVYGDDTGFPFLSIVEHLTADINVDTAGQNAIERAEVWVLLIHGWLEVSPDHPTDNAYQLKAAVEHRLARCIKMTDGGDPAFPSEYLLGLTQTITNLTIGPGVVSVATREQASGKAFFYLPLGVHLAIDVSDPFLPASP